MVRQNAYNNSHDNYNSNCNTYNPQRQRNRYPNSNSNRHNNNNNNTNNNNTNGPQDYNNHQSHLNHQNHQGHQRQYNNHKNTNNQPTTVAGGHNLSHNLNSRNTSYSNNSSHNINNNTNNNSNNKNNQRQELTGAVSSSYSNSNTSNSIAPNSKRTDQVSAANTSSPPVSNRSNSSSGNNDSPSSQQPTTFNSNNTNTNISGSQSNAAQATSDLGNNLKVEENGQVSNGLPPSQPQSSQSQQQPSSVTIPNSIAHVATAVTSVAQMPPTGIGMHFMDQMNPYQMAPFIASPQMTDFRGYQAAPFNPVPFNPNVLNKKDAPNEQLQPPPPPPPHPPHPMMQQHMYPMFPFANSQPYGFFAHPQSGPVMSPSVIPSDMTTHQQSGIEYTQSIPPNGAAPNSAVHQSMKDGSVETPAPNMQPAAAPFYYYINPPHLYFSQTHAPTANTTSIFSPHSYPAPMMIPNCGPFINAHMTQNVFAHQQGPPQPIHVPRPTLPLLNQRSKGKLDK